MVCIMFIQQVIVIDNRVAVSYALDRMTAALSLYLSSLQDHLCHDGHHVHPARYSHGQ